MLAERGLTMLRYGPDRALLLYGLTGGRSEVRQAHRQVKSILRTTGGLYVGTLIGEQWRHSRFRTPYLRNTLWTRGYATDTLETALTWSGVLALADALKTTLRTSLGEAEPVLAFSHLSHVYHDGASIYVTFLFRRAADPHETLEKWVKLKDNASRTILEHGGTISHQHGVGSDHAPYLPQEKGEAGMASLLAVQQALDPAGIFNPGNLLGDG
jgi:alkyldihydroxyacetonephosphate synthase